MCFFKLISVYIILILAITSCSYSSQDIRLNPRIKTSSSKVGNNSVVHVVVLDKRNNKVVIGIRGKGKTKDALINNRQNLAELIRKNVVDALKKKSFNAESKYGKTLEISLLNLKYKSSFGLIHNSSKVDAALEASVINGAGIVIYKKSYRTNIEKKHTLTAPLAHVNAKNINLSFESVMNKMLGDEKLIEALR